VESTTPAGKYTGPEVQLLGPLEVSQLLGCSTSTVHNLGERGDIVEYPHARCRQRLYTRESVEAHLAVRDAARASEGD